MVVGVVALYYHRLEGWIKVISAEVLERRERDLAASGVVPDVVIPGSPLGGADTVRLVREGRRAPFIRRPGDD